MVSERYVQVPFVCFKFLVRDDWCSKLEFLQSLQRACPTDDRMKVSLMNQFVRSTSERFNLSDSLNICQVLNRIKKLPTRKLLVDILMIVLGSFGVQSLGGLGLSALHFDLGRRRFGFTGCTNSEARRVQRPGVDLRATQLRRRPLTAVWTERLWRGVNRWEVQLPSLVFLLNRMNLIHVISNRVCWLNNVFSINRFYDVMPIHSDSMFRFKVKRSKKSFVRAFWWQKITSIKTNLIFLKSKLSCARIKISIVLQDIHKSHITSTERVV